MTAKSHDLCTIIVSHNSKRWLDPALTSLYEHAGDIDLDIVVVDNGTDGSAKHVETHFENVRTIRCANRGFGHANNRALETANARYVLFLNPDTEVLTGSLSELVSALDIRPTVGLAGVRQLRADGSLAPSMRRFPSVSSMLAEALAVERVPGVRRLLGERQLDLRSYDRETPCDWTSGSFMLARSEALESTGWFDEQFFLFAEEADLCWRFNGDGWGVTHMPTMTIRHDDGDGSPSPMLEAQCAYGRMQLAFKHFPRLKGQIYRAALALRYSLRVGIYSTVLRRDEKQRRALRAALAAVVYRRSPFDSGNHIAGETTSDVREPA